MVCGPARRALTSHVPPCDIATRVNLDVFYKVYEMSGASSAAGLSPDGRDRYIVERLRAAGSPLSGEALSAELGVSRVALWKRVASLRAWGYGIEATRKGYELVRDDGLAGWELEAPGPVLLFDTVGSTMDEARALAAAGAPSGATVLALGQRSGRGRAGGPWDSPAGGLYLSTALRSPLPPSHAGALSLEAAAATLRALEAAGAPGLSYSWPGELRRGGDKVGGVLVEAYGDVAAAEYYVVGVGLSVAPGLLAEGSAARRASVAAAVVRELVAWCAAPRLEPGRWDRLAPPTGRRMTVELWNGERRSLSPAGFDSRGDLIAKEGGPSLSIGEYRSRSMEG